MMRHPAEPMPAYIDPWEFARNRRICAGEVPVSATHALREWAAEDNVIHLSLTGDVDKNHYSRLSGSVAVTLQLQCQRCLEMMPYEVRHDFDYVLIADAAQEDRIEDGSETFICASHELELAWFVEEEILLAMPMIAKHDNCEAPQGYTAEPAENPPDTENPFAALKELMKSKEQS